MISLDKKYETRSGLDVELFVVSRKIDYGFPVAGETIDSGSSCIRSWTKEGFHNGNGDKSDLDLIEVKPKVKLPIRYSDGCTDTQLTGDDFNQIIDYLASEPWNG